MKHACLFDSQGSFGPSIVLPANLPRQTGVLFKNGPGGLKHQVRYLIPENPGIYGLKDNNGALFYVGKAKNLRARLLSYFRKKPSKEKKLIRKAASLIWENTFTEFLALLRELEVINLKRPLANVAGKICAFRAGVLDSYPWSGAQVESHSLFPQKYQNADWSVSQQPCHEECRQGIKRLLPNARLPIAHSHGFF